MGSTGSLLVIVVRFTTTPVTRWLRIHTSSTVMRLKRAALARMAFKQRPAANSIALVAYKSLRRSSYLTPICPSVYYSGICVLEIKRRQIS
jgi:hypothetical protein